MTKKDIIMRIRNLAIMTVDNVQMKDRFAEMQAADSEYLNAGKTKAIGLGMWLVKEKIDQILKEIDAEENCLEPPE